MRSPRGKNTVSVQGRRTARKASMSFNKAPGVPHSHTKICDTKIASADFEIGEIIWAKMRGYPPWPGRISKPLSSAKPPKYKASFIYFFGSNNYAWIMHKNLIMHSEGFLHTMKKNKSLALQKAVKELVTFSKSSQKNKYKVNEKATMRNISQKRHRGAKAGVSTSLIKQKVSEISLFSCPAFRITGTVDVPVEEDSVQEKHISPTKKKIGFIGLGDIGGAVVRHLIRSGHDLTVWNRTTYKCDEFIAMGAKKAESPADLVTVCDITFCCVSDDNASKAVVFGERGIIVGLERAQKLDMLSRGYVEMSSIDPATSLDIKSVITAKGGKYLEAPIWGNAKNAVEGSLHILTAGSIELFLESESCFRAMGRHAFFTHCRVGFASKYSLLLNMLSGSLSAAVSENLDLAQRLGLQKDRYLTLLSLGPLHCQNIFNIIKRMIKSDIKTVTPLKHVQNNLNLTLMMGNQIPQGMPLTAAANEVFKHAKYLKYSNSDVTAVSAVYKGVNVL